jgi:hypothetical protein
LIFLIPLYIGFDNFQNCATMNCQLYPTHTVAKQSFIITTIKWCKNFQTVGHFLKFLFLRKSFIRKKWY